MNELTITPEPIHEYCKKHSTPPGADLERLSRATVEFAPQVAHMQVGHLEGNFLAILIGLMSAKNILEFGTFTGYSALAMAQALPSDGKVMTIDRDPKATLLAKEHWSKSESGSKIELLLGEGKILAKELMNKVQSGLLPEFDLAFIDADKSGYDAYYEACLTLVRSGGAIIVDNVLWSGAVLDPQENSDRTIHAFNQKIANDSRVRKVMLPVRDGISVMIKL